MRNEELEDHFLFGHYPIARQEEGCVESFPWLPLEGELRMQAVMRWLPHADIACSTADPIAKKGSKTPKSPPIPDL